MEWTVETNCLTSSLHYLELKVQKYSKSLFIKIIKILQNAGIRKKMGIKENQKEDIPVVRGKALGIHKCPGIYM